MKRNDFATFVAYLLMIGLAILVGLVWLRDAMTSSTLPLPGIVLVIISMAVGIILNAFLLELGHLLGAKTGHYKVRSFIVLGIGFKMKDGVKKKGFNSFGGLTGETKVSPLDPEKSRLGGYIAFPLLFFLVEIIICAILVGIGGSSVSSELGWLKVVGITLMGITGMIVIYDYFPARLDEVNDGFLMIVTSKNVNKTAYNHELLAEEAAELNQPTPAPKVYEEVTDYTFYINNKTVYKLIKAEDYKRAIKILDLAIKTEKGLAKSKIEWARCMKLSLLLSSRATFEEGKAFYEEFEDSTKSYISSLSNIVSVRCYILISSFLEDSEGECNFAIEKAKKVLKGEEPEIAEIERALSEKNVEFVRNIHPGWTVEDLPWIEEESLAK